MRTALDIGVIWLLCLVLFTVLWGRFFRMIDPWRACNHRIEALPRDEWCKNCSERLECDTE